MALINDNYLKLQAGYLFPEIARRVKSYSESNPKAQIIRMGIGDVVLPLPQAAREAMKVAVDELGTLEGFRGYGPENGYDFLREAIAKDYQEIGVTIDPSEIFVSDGSKCDSGNIQEIFSLKAKIAITDPVYPVYVDSNVMAGRTGVAKDGRYDNLIYLSTYGENEFDPPLPQQKVDVVYLCSPNNPTGTVISRESLTKWVEWANAHQAIILFDAAYEAFITESNAIHSIFEIPGARTCALEIKSFSKQGGFTGVRCAYQVIPKELMGATEGGEKVSIQSLWARRHSTKFNGVSYPVQRGAAALFSPEGKKQTREIIQYYLENAQQIRKTLESLGYTVHGGINAPYVWVKNLPGKKSWEMFDLFLNQAQIVITPGSGFGACGEGYFRISAFALKEKVHEALERIKTKLS